VAALNRRSDIIDILLPLCPQYVINARDGREGKRSLFASDEFAYRVLSGSTALHFACLTGDMEIVEKLLRAGADKGRCDANELIPEQMIDCRSGDDKKALYRRICEEEEERRRLEQEEEHKRRMEELGGNKPPTKPIGSNS
jgi:ATP-dependent Clp protease ATP-binding subunit ClpB